MAREQREAFYDAARAHAPYVAAKTRWGTFVVSTTDKRVGRKLFASGGRSEMKTLARAINVLDGRATGGMSQRRTIVDVGANIGTTTVPALLNFGFDRAVAVEPEPGNFRVLQANLALNGVLARTRALQLAVSNSVGEARLARHAFNSGAHQLRAGSGLLPIEVPGDELGEELVVETTTLDALVAGGLIEPEDVGLLWLDVQGHEGHALSGAGTLLERLVPIVLEVSAEALARADGGRLLLESVRDYAQFVDLRGRTPEFHAVAELEDALADASKGITDILLLPA